MAWCLFGLVYSTRTCTTFIIGIHSVQIRMCKHELLSSMIYATQCKIQK